MVRIPREPSIESTLALRADPYRFISRRCRARGTDLFEARILLRRTLCMTGVEAARLFYDEDRFVRAGAAPARLVRTLFGKGSVQTLDGAEHRHRKRMLLEILAPERVGALVETAADVWASAAQRWQRRRQVVLYPAMQKVLARAACAWAGVPLQEREVAERTRQIAAPFAYAGSLGFMHGYARSARRQSEAWLCDVVHGIRSSEWKPGEGSAAYVIAWHRDRQGHLLDLNTAAVELLNVLRPIVAVSVWITFVAHALRAQPGCHAKLGRGDAAYAERFVQEVRRIYPFFPAVVARVRRPFEWRGYRLPQGRRALLDLWGTNHDPRSWQSPDEFDPDRFLDGALLRYAFIPQGGGDLVAGHRCPGEDVSVELMKLATLFLAQRLSYAVPPQRLSLDMASLPALPHSGFVMRYVRLHD